MLRRHEEGCGGSYYFRFLDSCSTEAVGTVPVTNSLGIVYNQIMGGSVTGTV